jgi:hypothetical protein
MMATVVASRCSEYVLVITESCVMTLHIMGGGTNVLEEHTISIFMAKTNDFYDENEGTMFIHIHLPDYTLLPLSIWVRICWAPLRISSNLEPLSFLRNHHECNVLSTLL